MRWIEEARANYGEGSLFWQTRVEAQFPTDDTDDSEVMAFASSRSL
ncbi:MAG: hypothetical protein KME49_08655 [Brasilonema octagenarum HA4186-MV1]|nr:hypothetical protein [Brasilonema octagenarum HA4186-MV1]